MSAPLLAVEQGSVTLAANLVQAVDHIKENVDPSSGITPTRPEPDQRRKHENTPSARKTTCSAQPTQ